MTVVLRRLTALSLIAGIHGSAAATSDIPRDPFAWLQPVVSIDAAARGRLDRGEVVVRILPAGDGELGVFAASRLDTAPEMLAVWAASIADLKKSPYVLAVQRFSDPPVLDDLDGLRLDDADVESVRDCRPGSCGLKLAAAEIESLRRAADAGGPLWQEAVTQRFRQIVLDRVNAYRAAGFAGLAPNVDRRGPVHPQAVFSALLGHSPYIRAGSLDDQREGADSYFYWSKEHYGTGKPVIAVTHVDLVRATGSPGPGVAMIGAEILATHYRTASLGMTAVVEDAGGQAYLVYINRSRLDVLGGLFGGLKRAIVESRVKSESVQVFTALRQRLESGPPGGD